MMDIFHKETLQIHNNSMLDVVECFLFVTTLKSLLYPNLLFEMALLLLYQYWLRFVLLFVWRTNTLKNSHHMYHLLQTP